MNTLRTVMYVTGIVLLTSCASAPKTPLSDAGYAAMAREFVGAAQCAKAGHVTPEIAALGWRYTRASLGTYSFDPERMRSTAETVDRTAITSHEWCVGMAMAIESKRLQIEQNNASNAANKKEWTDAVNSFNNSMPKQTYCNKIGTQVLCSTY
jgi:hypothetical protein